MGMAGRVCDANVHRCRARADRFALSDANGDMDAYGSANGYVYGYCNADDACDANGRGDCNSDMDADARSSHAHINARCAYSYPDAHTCLCGGGDDRERLCTPGARAGIRPFGPDPGAGTFDRPFGRSGRLGARALGATGGGSDRRLGADELGGDADPDPHVDDDADVHALVESGGVGL